MRAALALVALAGCWPAMKTTTTVVGRVQGEPVPKTTGQVQIDAEIADEQVVVKAVLPRECTRENREVVEIESKRTLHAVGQDHAAMLPLWILFVAVPWTGVALAGVSATMVLVDSGSKHTEERLVDSETVDCSLPAPNIAIELALPSGDKVDGATDGSGVYRYALDSDALEAGPVIVRMTAAEVATR